MNIVKEDIDALNALLKVRIEKDDYLEKVEDALKNYRKNIAVKGFRKGKVPTSMVKSMYGNGILLDELNKIIGESTAKFLEEEKIEILGRPIPKESDDFQLDIKSPQDYDFEYELGLTPEVSIDAIGASLEVDKQLIKIDDKILNDEVDRMRMQYGNMTNPEGAIEDNDILTFQLDELADGKVKEGGVSNETPIDTKMLKDGKDKKAIYKLKLDKSVDVDVFELLDRDAESIRKHILGIEDDELLIGNEFRLTLKKIGRIEKAELNEEFFNKIYGEGVIKSEDELKEKIKGEIEKYFSQQVEAKYKDNIFKSIMDVVSIDLPDSFLKRWIKFSNEKPISDEQIEAEYGDFAKNLKWSLIVNKIGKENNIEPEKEEIEAFSKEQLRQQLSMYQPGQPIEDKDLDMLNSSMMQREDHVKKTYDAMMEQKLFTWIEGKITTKEKEVSLEDFQKQN